MRNHYLIVAGALAAWLCLVSGPPLVAQDTKGDVQKGTNVMGEKAGAVKVSPEAEAVAQVALAQSLIKYGRAHKSPQGLITAAEILGRIKPQPSQVEPTTKQEGKPTTVPKAQSDTDRFPDDPPSLLAEAKKMAPGDPHIAALADSVSSLLEEKTRGRVAQPIIVHGRAPAYTSQTYTWQFYGGEIARVAVSGDGDTDLDLYVYDANDNLITSDTGRSDDCIACWVPRWTATFYIKVVNLGSVCNEYVLVTN